MASITFLILQCVYFILPAYFSNMAPVLVKKIDFLKIPIDFGHKLNGKPLFGKSKTFRGLIFGIIFAIVITFIQFLLYEFGIGKTISLVDYSNWLILGFLMGLGALLGDLIESFFKRRLNLEPGKPFIPFDQVDFILGALLLTYPIASLSISKIIIIISISFVLHIVVNHSAFYLKIRNEKW